MLSVSEFQRGATVIYRHRVGLPYTRIMDIQGEDVFDDSVMFFVYPASETAKRSSRLRVTVPIKISKQKDPLVQV